MRTLSQKTPLVLIAIILSVWFFSPATAKARAATLPVPSLTATVQANPAVLLAWTLPFKSSITGFKIERSLDPLSGYVVIATASKSATSYNDASAVQGEGYYYRVRSYKSSAYSEYSNIVFVDVPPAASVDSIPPIVSITSPLNGTSYSAAQNVSITASAQDNVGVSKVEFYQGGVLKKTVTAAPYMHDWAISSADNGSHSFTAKAYDAKGNVASSVAVGVSVDIQTVTAEYTAPALNSVTVNGSDMVLAWSLPQTSNGTPAGGYDVFTDGVDDNLHHTTMTTTKGGLQQGVEHCFTVESRWTQAVPPVFPASNQICKLLPDSTKPSVTIDSPSSGTTVTTAQAVTVSASAQDNIGISKVEFYDGATLKATDTSAPYAYVWSVADTDNGSHSFTAKAYDATGNVSNSSNVSISVNIPIVAAEYTAPVLNSVTANGSDMVLAWSLPQTAYGTPAGGYDVFTDGVDDNLHHTTLTATKSGLQQGVEHCFKVESRWTQAVPPVFPASNQICKLLPDVTKPVVAITSPVAGTTVAVAQTLSVTVTAEDNVGINKVEFYDGAVLKATDTSAPYSYDWIVTVANNGTHNLTAKAYDAAGNMTSSSAVSVSVNIQAAQYTAPVLEYVQESGSDFLLGWSQTTSSYGAPEGGYDIFIDGTDSGSINRTTQQTALISGLSEGTHCFEVEARWTQAVPAEYRLSNQLCATTTASEPEPQDGPVKVFPGATGFGTDSPAGRGGSIIKVTNLNDSGTGSLRAAVTASGPRIVVFEVSGRINLQSVLDVKNPYLTIAGQTAPSPGIQVTGRMLRITTHDVLIQHMRFRVGDEGKVRDGRWDSEDAIQVYTSNAYNVVLDHVTANWSIDDVFDVTFGAHDVSLLDSIIAEPLHDSVHSKGSHGYVSMVAYDSHRIFYARNLIGTGWYRLPLFKDSSLGLFNNLYYNARGSAFTSCTPMNEVPGVVTKASIVNNSYKDGPIGLAAYAIGIDSGTPAGSEFYISGNTYDAGPLMYGGSSFLVNSAPTNTWPVDYQPIPEGNVKSYVLANAGARPADRDAVEKRLIGDVTSLSGGMVNSQADVGGFPVYAVNTRAFNAGSNPNGDDDGDGYTNIEEILHQMALAVEGK